MDKFIPIPTDSIYKFYALFGVLLFVFSIGALLYVVKSTNELVFSSVIDIEIIRAIDKPTSVDSAKLAAAEKRVELAVSDRKFFVHATGLIAGIAVLSIAYGFREWHRKVQPVQDELAQLQLEKLRREIYGPITVSNNQAAAEPVKCVTPNNTLQSTVCDGD